MTVSPDPAGLLVRAMVRSRSEAEGAREMPGEVLIALTGWAGPRVAAAVLAVAERLLGPEHPATLTARANLARGTGVAGDAAGARDQFAALLPVRARVSGPEHPETLLTRANLALWTGQAGDAAGARDQFAALLPVEERALGPEHWSTLATRGSVAYWAKQAGSKPEDSAGGVN